MASERAVEGVLGRIADGARDRLDRLLAVAQATGGERQRQRQRGRYASGGSLAADEEDIFPDPNARAMADLWWGDPKGFERAFSGMAA